MGALLTCFNCLGPVLLRGAEAGTLIEIAETGARLFALIRPLLTDPKTKAALDEACRRRSAATASGLPSPRIPSSHAEADPFGGR